MHKKSGFLIVLSLVFLLLMINNVVAQEDIFGDAWEIFGNTLNPLFRTIFGDAFDFAGENLWFFVTIYVAALSILVYVVLKRVKYFAEAPKLAKWLSFLLVVGFITGSTGAAAGAFGPLPASITPLVILFLLFKLGSGAAGAAGAGLGAGRDWGAPEKKPGLFSRGWGWMKKRKAARKEEEKAAQRLNVDGQIDGLVSRANKIEVEVSNDLDAIEKEQYDLEKYKERLKEYVETYTKELEDLNHQLEGLRYGITHDMRDPAVAREAKEKYGITFDMTNPEIARQARERANQLEEAIRKVEQKYGQALNAIKQAIRQEEDKLEREEADLEREEQAVEREIPEEKKQLEEELLAFRETRKAMKDDDPQAKELDKKIEAYEKKLKSLTAKERKLAKKKKKVIKKEEKKVKKTKKELEKEWEAVNKLEGLVGQLGWKGVGTFGDRAEEVKGKVNEALAELFPRKKPVLRDAENAKKLHEEFKGLEREEIQAETFKRKLRERASELQEEEKKAA